MRKEQILWPVIAMLVAAGAAMAQERGPMRGGPDAGFAAHRFAGMDGDKDGSVTQAEIAAFHKARAAEIDTDRNGEIGAAELEAFLNKERQRALEARLKRMDTNGDGRVSVEEFVAGSVWGLARLDRDGSGTIEADEISRRRAWHHGPWGRSY